MPSRGKKTTKTKPAVKDASKSTATTVEALVEQGTIALSRMEPELACKFFDSAQKKSPADTSLMDALADARMQMGDGAGAIELLSQSTSLAPAENPVKWLYFAQLKEGHDSLVCYRSAIGHLEAQSAAQATAAPSAASGSASASASAGSADNSKHICRAHCSIAELYLTDLW